MKKLTLIMLAIVSMALVSCGGGEDEGVKPANPAIIYNDNASILDGCFEVKNVAIRQTSLYEISVTATLEVIKDVPPLGLCPEISDPYKSMNTVLYVYDKNMAKICNTKYALPEIINKKKGDIINISQKTKDLDILASEVIKDAKYVEIQVKDLGL